MAAFRYLAAFQREGHCLVAEVDWLMENSKYCHPKAGKFFAE